MADGRHERGGEADDVIDRAAAALRDAPVPEGPPPHVARDTLTAMRAAAGRKHDTSRRNSIMSFTWKIAAVVAVALCGVAVYVAFRPPPDPGQQSQTDPPPGPRPIPYTLPATSPDRLTEPVPEIPVPGGAGSVAGRVVFKGEPPEMQEIDMGAVPQCAEQHADPVYQETVVVNENGTLRNVVVSVSEGLPADAQYDPPAHPAILDQRGCRYEPHVLAVMVGQEVRAMNSDPFLHNVHTLPVENVPANRGQPNIDRVGMKLGRMQVPEAFPVKCDVHPWMLCWFVAFDHPYFFVTGDDGAFRLDELPAGEYTVKAWHEKFGEQIQRVTVEAGRAADVTFTFAQ
jgi:hypothetical protein